MPLNNAIEFARRHLIASVCELEKDAQGARYNTSCIGELANVSLVLGQRDVAERALRLLRAAPDVAFSAGMITNIELSKTVLERLRTVDPLEKLEDQYAPYREEEIVGHIRSYARTEEHLALCLEGRTEEARSTAGSGLRLEEVGVTLAVLGEFDAALSVARDPLLEHFRQRGVLLILVIEFFRRGQMEYFEAILAELESSGLGPWDRILLALGIANREPWTGYPYPDW